MKLTLTITSIAIIIYTKCEEIHSEKISIGLSFIHFNARNLITNLVKIKDYARMHARTHACTHARTRARTHAHTRTHTHKHELGIRFDIITISETWL